MATILTLLGRRPAPAPKLRIVEVTNHWRVSPEGYRREVLAAWPDGSTVVRYLPDAHPALVRYLARAAA
jgi:hypothetical protein